MLDVSFCGWQNSDLFVKARPLTMLKRLKDQACSPFSTASKSKMFFFFFFFFFFCGVYVQITSARVVRGILRIGFTSLSRHSAIKK